MTDLALQTYYNTWAGEHSMKTVAEIETEIYNLSGSGSTVAGGAVRHFNNAVLGKDVKDDIIKLTILLLAYYTKQGARIAADKAAAQAAKEACSGLVDAMLAGRDTTFGTSFNLFPFGEFWADNDNFDLFESDVGGMANNSFCRLDSSSYFISSIADGSAKTTMRSCYGPCVVIKFRGIVFIFFASDKKYFIGRRIGDNQIWAQLADGDDLAAISALVTSLVEAMDNADQMLFNQLDRNAKITFTGERTTNDDPASYKNIAEFTCVDAGHISVNIKLNTTIHPTIYVRLFDTTNAFSRTWEINNGESEKYISDVDALTGEKTYTLRWNAASVCNATVTVELTKNDTLKSLLLAETTAKIDKLSEDMDVTAWGPSNASNGVYATQLPLCYYKNNSIESGTGLLGGGDGTSNSLKRVATRRMLYRDAFICCKKGVWARVYSFSGINNQSSNFVGASAQFHGNKLLSDVIPLTNGNYPAYFAVVFGKDDNSTFPNDGTAYTAELLSFCGVYFRGRQYMPDVTTRSINSNTGAIQASGIRLSTRNAVPARDIVVRCTGIDAEYKKVALDYYSNDAGDSSGFISTAHVNLDRNTGLFVAPENAVTMRITYGYSDNRDIVDEPNVYKSSYWSDLQLGVEIYTDDMPEYKEYMIFADKIDQLPIDNSAYDALYSEDLFTSYAVGGINISTGTPGADTDILTRIKTEKNNKITTPDILITVPNGYKLMRVVYYDQRNNFIGASDSIDRTGKVVTKNMFPNNACYARLLFSKTNNQESISSEELTAFTSAVRVSTVPGVQEHGLFPDRIESEGLYNAILNLKQAAKIKYTPIENLPQQTGAGEGADVTDKYFPKNVEYTGLPYSSARMSNGYVPDCVSFETFMTAIQNPNSYLYTINSQGNGNGKTYYGAVCSSLVRWAIGILPQYVTKDWSTIPDMILSKNQHIRAIKQGDILCSHNGRTGHVVIVTEVLRDYNGRVGQFHTIEAISPRVREKVYVRDNKGYQFSGTYIIAADDDDPEGIAADNIAQYDIYRYDKMDSVTHEQIPFVTVGDETPMTPYTYNNALMLRKGNKSNWLMSETVEIDVYDTSAWMGAELYKDNVQITPPAIASVIQLSNLAHGRYKMRLTGTNNSDWIEWIVVSVSASITAQDTNTVTVEFTQGDSIAAPMFIQFAQKPTDNPTSGNNYSIRATHVLTDEDKTNHYAVCQKPDQRCYARVFYKTEYGMIATADTSNSIMA